MKANRRKRCNPQQRRHRIHRKHVTSPECAMRLDKIQRTAYAQRRTLEIEKELGLQGKDLNDPAQREQILLHIASLEDEFDSLKLVHELDKSAYEDELQLLRKLAEDTQCELDSANAKINELESVLANLQKHLAVLSQDNNDIGGDLSGLKASLEQAIQTLQMDKQAHEEASRKAQQRRKEAHESIDRVTQLIQKHEKELAKLNQRKEKLEEAAQDHPEGIPLEATAKDGGSTLTNSHGTEPKEAGTAPVDMPAPKTERKGSKTLHPAEKELGETKEKVQVLEARIAGLQEQIEDLKFQVGKDSSTSSIPNSKSGYRGVGMHCKDPDHRDDLEELEEGKNTDGDLNGESKSGNIANDDTEAEINADAAALHNQNKSPNRKKQNCKRGKKKGGHGGGRTFTPNATVQPVQYCDPVQCASCPNHAECMKHAKLGKTRNVEELDLNKGLIRQPYQTRSVQCPQREGEWLQGEYPLDVGSSINIGPRIRTLAILMSTVGMVSYMRISTILSGFLGMNVSHESVEEWVKLAAQRAEDPNSMIAQKLLEEPYACVDETGAGVDGKLHWIHTFCNSEFTYLYLDRKRGSEAMKRGGMLPFYTGTIISDCWSSYFRFENVNHGLCNAHLLRELLALEQFYAKDKQWAHEMSELLKEMDHARNELEPGKIFAPEVIEAYEKRYDEIVAKGFSLHPESETAKRRGRKKSQAEQNIAGQSSEKKSVTPLRKAMNLLKRLRDYKEYYLLFLRDRNVPFTNNCAERSFRCVATKRSVVGCFRSINGAQNFVSVWGFVSSAGKQGYSAYEAIHALMTNTGADLFFTQEEQVRLRALVEERRRKMERSAAEELAKIAEQEAEKEAKKQQKEAKKAEAEAKKADRAAKRQAKEAEKAAKEARRQERAARKAQAEAEKGRKKTQAKGSRSTKKRSKGAT